LKSWKASKFAVETNKISSSLQINLKIISVSLFFKQKSKMFHQVLHVWTVETAMPGCTKHVTALFALRTDAINQ